jgi:hypothetical protein
MPRYRGIKLDGSARVYDNLRIWLGATEHRADIHLVGGRGVNFYFVDSPALYDREGLYGDARGDYLDNYVRFAFLARVGPGTRFLLEQEPVAGDLWLPKHFSMHVNASALGFINEDSVDDETYRDYRPMPQTSAALQAQ